MRQNSHKNKECLAYQTRFSSIFTSADKSDLTYPYPTRDIDKKTNNNICCQLIHLLYRGSDSVIKMLGVDVIATSDTTSAFYMADINVQELDSWMVTPMLKSDAGDQKVCKKKNLSWLFGADRQNPSKSRDTKQWLSDRLFYLHLRPMKDTYNLKPSRDKENVNHSRFR